MLRRIALRHEPAGWLYFCLPNKFSKFLQRLLRDDVDYFGAGSIWINYIHFEPRNFRTINGLKSQYTQLATSFSIESVKLRRLF